ncbi:MAG: hypothetical protein DRP27_02540 [Thermotogae bacterium]|nr:MAG: hypothetical protein DRP27_02540 [Thermotogota bacterium]
MKYKILIKPIRMFSSGSGRILINKRIVEDLGLEDEEEIVIAIIKLNDYERPLEIADKLDLALLNIEEQINPGEVN